MQLEERNKGKVEESKERKIGKKEGSNGRKIGGQKHEEKRKLRKVDKGNIFFECEDLVYQ